jgi:hypothetical protein
MRAKSFGFALEEVVSILRVIEGLVCSVSSVGRVIVNWLLDTMEELLLAEALKEFLKSSKVGFKAFIAKWFLNKLGINLGVAEYGGGGRRGIVVLSKGRGGRGWAGFVLKFQKVLEAF